jgi:hypothetical protein
MRPVPCTRRRRLRRKARLFPSYHDGAAAKAQEEVEAASEAGIVDIASILGSPTVTVVQSTL